MTTRGLVWAFLSAIVLAVLAWVGCWVWEEIAAESTGDFPDGVLCAVTWAAAIIGWIYMNFGNVLRR